MHIYRIKYVVVANLFFSIGDGIMYMNLFSTFTGLLSLGVIVFILGMAVFFIRLFMTAKPQDEDRKKS